MPASMIASVVVTCASLEVTFTPDTSAAWLAYDDSFSVPLYLPAVREPPLMPGHPPP